MRTTIIEKKMVKVGRPTVARCKRWKDAKLDTVKKAIQCGLPVRALPNK
jgi:hypothetical protein